MDKTELNDLIHIGVKLVGDKNGIPQSTQTEVQNLDGKWRHNYK